MSILQPPFPTPILQGGYDVPVEASRTGAMAAGATETPFDLSVPVAIDTIVVGSTTPDLTIQLSPRNKSGTLVPRRAVGAGIGSTGAPSLTLIRDGRSPHFQVLAWDEIANRYLVALRAPLLWPRGGQVIITAPTAATVTAHINYRTTGAA